VAPRATARAFVLIGGILSAPDVPPARTHRAASTPRSLGGAAGGVNCSHHSHQFDLTEHGGTASGRETPAGPRAKDLSLPPRPHPGIPSRVRRAHLFRRRCA